MLCAYNPPEPLREIMERVEAMDMWYRASRSWPLKVARRRYCPTSSVPARLYHPSKDWPLYSSGLRRNLIIQAGLAHGDLLSFYLF